MPDTPPRLTPRGAPLPGRVYVDAEHRRRAVVVTYRVSALDEPVVVWTRPGERHEYRSRLRAWRRWAASATLLPDTPAPTEGAQTPA